MPQNDDSSLVSLPEGLRQQFDIVERQLWRVETTLAVCAIVTGVVSSMLALFISDRLWDTPVWLRMAIFLCGVTGATMAAIVWGRHWIWHRRDIRALATLVQRKYRRLGDRLLGIVELANEQRHLANFSPALYHAAIAQVAEEAVKYDFKASVNTRTMKRFGWSAAGFSACLLAASVLLPQASWNAVLRWLAPGANIERYTLVTLEGFPKSMVVPHGEDFVVTGNVRYRSFWKPSTALARLGLQTKTESAVTADHVRLKIPGQVENGVLNVRVGDALAKVQILPNHRPSLQELSALVQLPDYLRYPDLSEAVQNGSMTAVEGSRIAFRGKTSRPLSSAVMQAGTGETPAPLKIDGENFQSGVSEPTGISEFVFNWRDDLGLTNSSPWRLRVVPEKDMPPVPDMPDMARVTPMLSSDVLHIRVDASDDFGVRDVGLMWDVVGDATPESMISETKMELPDAQEKKVEKTFNWSPQMNRIPDGATVELAAFARDYMPKRDRAKTSSYIIRVLSPEEHAEMVREELEAIMAQIEDITRAQEKVVADTQAAHDAGQSATNSQTLAQLNQARDEQLQNAQRLLSLAQRGEDAVREAMKNPLLPEQTVQQWAQTLQQWQQLSDQKMQEAAQAMQQAAQNSQQREQNQQQNSQNQQQQQNSQNRQAQNSQNQQQNAQSQQQQNQQAQNSQNQQQQNSQNQQRNSQSQQAQNSQNQQQQNSQSRQAQNSQNQQQNAQSQQQQQNQQAQNSQNQQQQNSQNQQQNSQSQQANAQSQQEQQREAEARQRQQALAEQLRQTQQAIAQAERGNQQAQNSNSQPRQQGSQSQNSQNQQQNAQSQQQRSQSQAQNSQGQQQQNSQSRQQNSQSQQAQNSQSQQQQNSQSQQAQNSQSQQQRSQSQQQQNSQSQQSQQAQNSQSRQQQQNSESQPQSQMQGLQAQPDDPKAREQAEEEREQELEDALKRAQEVLAALQQMEQNANQHLDQLQALTLAQRLRKVGEQEKTLGGQLTTNMADTIGLPPEELPDKFKRMNASFVKTQGGAQQESSALQSEIGRFFERTQRETYGQVAKDMKDSAASDELDRMGGLIESNITIQTSLDLTNWSARFEKWADELQPKRDPSESGEQQAGNQQQQQQGQQQEQVDLTQQLIALLRMREREMDLRDQTGMAEAAKQDADHYKEQATSLNTQQRNLVDALEKIHEATPVPDLDLPFKQTSAAMGEAQQLLGKPETDKPTDEAEVKSVDELTDLINLINEQAKRQQQQQQQQRQQRQAQQQQQEQGQRGNRGMTPEEMGFLMRLMQNGRDGRPNNPGQQFSGRGYTGGGTTDKTGQPVTGDVNGRGAAARNVNKAAGSIESYPAEFRDALENYFHGVENPK